jgi:hypothetical protein
MQYGDELEAIHPKNTLCSLLLPVSLVRDNIHSILVPSARPSYQFGLQVGFVTQLQFTDCNRRKKGITINQER